ncbi:hypothetical protein PhCBS80983_g02202 [Powellomyces hirtus]|uniref:Major facilitator superfamily (MFS) profile domain-containing protein n=1 Tax=Powellomyces hirtus TaxID=109895 RepID=A0A507E7V3_9FUNG|nr:hypothetical protein PhCBS80983_g02202 [Powellomyces hirtus]
MASVTHHDEKKDIQTIVERGEYDDETIDPKHREREAALNREIDAKLMANPEKFPKAIYFIIPNELGERFCYYGINPILKPFLKKMLGYSIAKTDSVQHTWKAVTYFTPLAGAAISDSFLDKFKTIVSLSTVYLLGVVLLTVFSKPGLMPYTADGYIPATGPLVALFLISIGTGGIKPCVSSHGGDQFLNFQTVNLNKFYNYFYMSINLGSLIAGFITPYVQKLNCFGNDEDCFVWAFAICVFAFAIAMTVFIIGKMFYRVVPPSGVFFPWILFKAALSYTIALVSNGFNHSKAASSAAAKHTESVIIELFDLVKVFIVLLPVIIFWLGFDQNYSTWQDSTDQMSHDNWLNSEVTNAVINPFFIVTLAPIFANFVYPAVEKRVQFGLLRRMVLGMLFAAISFVAMALIQKRIDDNCVEVTSTSALGKETTACMHYGTHTAIMFIPYFFITVGEVLVSISGLNFTYMEVGKRTKSSAAGLWLLGTGVANLIVAVMLATDLGEPEKTPRSTFYWIIAGLCIGAMVLQAIFAKLYTYKADRVYKF